MTVEERESMELDVAFVGAGPANLAAAIRLMQNIEAHNNKAEKNGGEAIEEPMILIIDKAANVGNHTLSGAVIDPISFKTLFPNLSGEETPFITKVHKDQVYYLTKGGKIPLPGIMVPPEMHNKGYQLAALGEVTRFLAEKCEEMGAEVYTEFAANELMRDGDKIIGVKIADKGLNPDGTPGDNFSPGMDLEAKVTVLGEGTRGYLAEQLIENFGLAADKNPQVWGVGLKEIIEVPKGRIEKGEVIHTFGYPLDSHTYGGSFIYGIDNNQVALGLVFGLDYPNPLQDSHKLFLQFKKHPFVASLIEGGKVIEYGAKTLPEGGLFSIPQLAVDGAVMVGDSAGMLNSMRLKGIHLAIQSGIMAGDRIYQAMVHDDFSAAKLDYRPDLEASWAGKELQKVRNYRQGFHAGLIPGMINTGMVMFTGGKMPGGRKTMPPDHAGTQPAQGQQETPKVETDENLYLDLLTDVYKSGSIHNEHQPAHCEIIDTEKCKHCFEQYQAPCTRFCPAQVYELETDEKTGAFTGIQVNFSNCVHCKTCEIKDPLANIRWHPPEGGDGPKYQRM